MASPKDEIEAAEKLHSVWRGATESLDRSKKERVFEWLRHAIEEDIENTPRRRATHGNL